MIAEQAQTVAWRKQVPQEKGWHKSLASLSIAGQYPCLGLFMSFYMLAASSSSGFFQVVPAAAAAAAAAAGAAIAAT